MPDTKYPAQLSSRLTRRRVVKTGARLAYAAPLVAASFKLTGRGGLAADIDCTCHSIPGHPGPFEQDAAGTKCCKCVCSSIPNAFYDRATDKCVNPDTNQPVQGCAPICRPPCDQCGGLNQVSCTVTL